MHQNQILFGISTILIASCLFIIGFLFKKNPPKQINYFYGYRSKNALKNQIQWNYAQKRATSEILRAGILQLLTLLLLPLIPGDIRYAPYCIAGIALILIINVLQLSTRTEKAIKKKFNT